MTNPPPPVDDLETLTRLAHDALEVYGPPTIVGAPVPGERRLALGFLALRQKLEEAEADYLRRHKEAGDWMDRALQAEAQRDDAIEFVGVMRDEAVIAGFPAGDRTVLLANFRTILAQRAALVKASSTAFAALRHVEDWQWGKREADLREDELLSADTVRPMVANAIAELKRALAAARAQAMGETDAS